MIKFPKLRVNFEHPGMGKDSCSKCKFFLPGENKCQIVLGDIMAKDWCDRFEKKDVGGTMCKDCDKSPCECRPYPAPTYREHDKVRSRITGKEVEIGMGPQPGNLVPANPFASLAQEGYMHAHPEILGKTALDEWDASTKGKKLPKHVKK